jgi:hypothetical protein
MTTYSRAGIFNALDYGVTAGPLTSAQRKINATNFQHAIDATQASGNPNGAIVLFPSYSIDPITGDPVYGNYEFESPAGAGTSAIEIPNTGSATPILICGTGGTQLSMHTGGAGAILFDVESDFVTFQDLTIGFDFTDTSGEGIAFSFSGSADSGPQGCGLFRVTIANCQYPVVLDATQHARLLECFIDYGIGNLTFLESAAVQIVGGSDDTVLSQSILQWSAGTQVSENYGVLIDGASNVKVSDTQITGFGTGIAVQSEDSISKTTGAYFAGLNVQTNGSCVAINCSVFDISFLDCRFQAAGNYTGTLAGIAIGMNGGTNADFDTVRLISCSLTGNSGMAANDTYGLQIGAGQNIEVHGGNYSGNGKTGGISIIGAASQIQIVGANCVGLEYEGGAESTPVYQLYGILITNGMDIQIIGVNCSGNGIFTSGSSTPGDGIHIDGSSATVSGVRIVGAVCTGPVFGNTDIKQRTGIYVNAAQRVLIKDCTLSGSTAGSGYGLNLVGVSDVTVKACDLNGNVTGMRIDTGSTRVYVRDCNGSGYAGYQEAISIASSLANVEVTNSAGYNDVATPLTSTPPAGVFNGVSVGYYGPTVFYVTHCSVTINTQATGLSSGGFTLAPGETAQVTAAIGGTFIMIGN